MSSACHPEEIECFRTPMPDGRFSPDKRYEYTYANRKSWEYISAIGREDWRYFTTKGFTYAGRWLRTEHSQSQGEEVFLDDRVPTTVREITVSVPRDSDGLLCWRECPYPVDDTTVIATTTREIMISSNDDDMKKRYVAKPPPPPPSNEISLIRCIFGCPSKCGLFDCAETTTMEAKYRVHDKIAEFWCFVTSLFYGSSLLLYLIKEEDWFESWRELGEWPAYIHFSIVISVLVMICSAVYHMSLLEVFGCVDCFLASFIFASVTMTTFGLDILTQVGVLLGIGVFNLYAWRYSTRIALIVVALIYPLAMLSCSKMKLYYGGAVFVLITAGIACFILDRMGIAPLHSLWHILGGGAITLSLYYVVVNGCVITDERGIISCQYTSRNLPT